MNFDALPATSSAAAYAREIKKEQAARWMSMLSDYARGYAEHTGASRNFAKRLGKWIEQIGPRGHQTVYARGPLVTSKDGDSTRLHPAWVLSGTTRPKAEVQKIADELSWVLASPELKKIMPEAPGFPSLRRSRKALKNAPGAVIYDWSLPEEIKAVARMLGAQLPPAWERDDVSDALDRNTKGVFAIVEMGGHTWTSWGADVGELNEAFGALSNKDAQKLGSQGDVWGLRKVPASGAAFAKIEALLGAFAWALPSDNPESWVSMRKAMPHQGAVPATYFFQVKSGSATKATWELRIPVEFTQDMVVLGLMLAAEAGISVDDFDN